MAKKKTDLSAFDDITKTMEEIERFVQSLSGQQIDLGKEQVFTQTPHLHQDSEGVTEKESAEFERDNKQEFDYLQSIDLKIDGILKKYK